MAATEKRQFIPGPGGMGDLPFSNAVIAGNTVYLSGHIGFDPATRKPPEDAEQEARLVLDGLRDTLTRAGLSLQDVVSLTVYCPDLIAVRTLQRGLPHLLPLTVPGARVHRLRPFAFRSAL